MFFFLIYIIFRAHLIAGCTAGALAAAITNPLDVCKTLLNTQVVKQVPGEYGGGAGEEGVRNEAIVCSCPSATRELGGWNDWCMILSP